MTGLQIEAGAQATAFERRPYTIELALCQRYYQFVASGINKPIAIGSYYGSSQLETVLQTKVPMRTGPTLSVTTGTNYYIATRNGGTDGFDSFVGDIANENSLLIYSATNVSGTAGDATRLQSNNASAFIAMQAEL